MGNCIKSKLIIEPPPYHYNVELTLDKDTCITELHKQISEITLEKDLCIAELHKQINELTLEKDTCIAELKQHTSLPPLNWELELETILKTFLKAPPGEDINKLKNNTNYHNSLNKNFTEISNSIKNININETINSMCYYSYTYNEQYVGGYITYTKFFLITNKNIYKLQIVSPEKNNIKIQCAPDFMVIPNNIGGYGGMSPNNIYNFIKCKSINEYISLASIDRYIKHTRGDKSSYRFRTQCGGSGFGSMNLEHDNNTMTRYLNDLESSLLSLF